jgi:catechol 2,3-dioxygenase-like lactoylglutathione lyase family enzyme
MKKVTGIGGIFFKSPDPAKTRQWYAEHLGFETTDYGSMFDWRSAEDPTQTAYTLWTPFKADTTYFAPSTKEFMVNFRVADLVGLLAELKEQGVSIVGEMQDSEYGKFAHILDPDGNKVELWEAPAEAP